MNFDMLVFIHPSLSCNFSCAYCGRGRMRARTPQDIPVDAIVQRLERFGKTFLVCIGGGEPFLSPNFIEFVTALTRKHFVRIDSNLSQTQACKKFASAIDPKRIMEISFSTHLAERQRKGIDPMEQVRLVREFQDKGFRMVGNYVAYPPLLGRMPEDMAFYSSQGIRVLPILFEGEFEGTRYPLGDNGRPSYTREELELITRYNPEALLPLTSPKGAFCQAGSSVFWVFDTFKVFPCHGIQEVPLGDFFGEWKTFAKVIRCPNRYCIDQYHKGFSCTLDRSGFTGLLSRTLREKGAYSAAASFMRLRKHWMRKPLSLAKRYAGCLLRRKACSR